MSRMTNAKLIKLLEAVAANTDNKLYLIEHIKDNPTVTSMYERNTGYVMAIRDVIDALNSNPVALKVSAE